MVIIGSTALREQGIDLRVPKDVDVMTTEIVPGRDCIVVPKSIIKLIPTSHCYATPDAVYTIKCSHLGWDIKWQKHKNDVLYLKSIGCKLLPELYNALVKHWREVNGNKEFLNMYKKKSDFFNDYVPYVYDHDYLHELVAYPDPPVYTNCLIDGEEVAIDKDKFFKLSLEQQLRMFKEEISVIAAERWLIPPKLCGKYSLRKAYSLALHKTITSLTKNWATDFLIEHLDYFVKFEYNYFEHLLNTIKEGKIIMANKVENPEVIRDEIIEAFNATEPRWEVDEESWYSLTDEIGELEGFKEIEQYGGGEGGAEDCTFTFQWKDKFYTLHYNYYSYHGYDFDYCEMYEVKPIQKMVIVYE